ncbi:hypothetical protein [Novosphingobium sp.]|uniref:hypothetical protein n=1 Tax=Novosphingobium sp. TaxID=1874826 RepID=UPI003B521DA0
MSAQTQFLAVFLGNAESPAMAQWLALSEAERGARAQAGIAAWGQWMTDNAASIVFPGGPLGKTKRVSRDGTTDSHNAMGGALVVQADSHEAAAALFVDHPQFTIFPGEAVEIMQIMPMPGQH